MILYDPIFLFCYVEIILFCTTLKKEMERQREKEQEQIQELITSLYTVDDVGVKEREMTLREYGVSYYQGDCYRSGSLATEFSFES
jgi:hypothetical protein